MSVHLGSQVMGNPIYVMIAHHFRHRLPLVPSLGPGTIEAHPPLATLSLSSAYRTAWLPPLSLPCFHISLLCIPIGLYCKESPLIHHTKQLHRSNN